MKHKGASESAMKGSCLKTIIAAAAALGMLLAGCGGGGGGDTAQGSASPGPSAPTLSWDPPTTFSDNTMMDPYRDLDYYEFYLRTDRNFTDNDLPVAQVAAVTNVLAEGGQSYVQDLTRSFDMNNLLPFTQNGTLYYLSIKSVGVDGLKSGFSPPVTWNQS